MQEILKRKTIILGVTGSIAAVKAPIVAKRLAEAGASVICVMTESAEQFVSREEMREATGREAIASMFHPRQPPPTPRLGKAGELDRQKFSELTWHVHLARSADAMLIAPCSASIIGMLRAGIYDNAVTLAAASLPKGTPLVIVPAMDEDMWVQPAVQENIEWLKKNSVIVIEPVSGPLASGLIGMGRMPEPEEIIEKFAILIQPPPSHRLEKAGEFYGKQILITGGPTYEPIDAVRFIGNRSSGKMAIALATEARNMGADVTLIMGPSLISSDGVAKRIDIESAQEMLKAVKAEAPNADIIIMSAAVADFAPENAVEGKLKKGSEETMTLALKKNPDILAEIARSKKPNQIIVGFALEKGDNAESYAKKKLKEKNLDMIVLNNIAEEGAGFAFDTNKISIFTRDGSKSSYPLLSKAECAQVILDTVIKMSS